VDALIRERDKERGIHDTEDGTWEQITHGSEGASLAKPGDNPACTEESKLKIAKAAKRALSSNLVLGRSRASQATHPPTAG